MPIHWKTPIPTEPDATYVIVRNIAGDSSEKTVKEFFLFCGKIQEFEMQSDEEHPERQVALIHFERASAAKTATLLSNALIDESHIICQSYFDIPTETHEKSADSGDGASQELKPKFRIAAEILASGYMLQDHVVAKGLEYDSKYDFSNKITTLLHNIEERVKHFDEKFRIWDKAVNIDQKYKIHETVQHVAERAQEALQTPTGQKVQDFANQTLAQIAAVHYEAKKIQNQKLHPQESSSP